GSLAAGRNECQTRVRAVSTHFGRRRCRPYSSLSERAPAGVGSWSEGFLANGFSASSGGLPAPSAAPSSPVRKGLKSASSSGDSSPEEAASSEAASSAVSSEAGGRSPSSRN